MERLQELEGARAAADAELASAQAKLVQHASQLAAVGESGGLGGGAHLGSPCHLLPWQQGLRRNCASDNAARVHCVQLCAAGAGGDALG